MTNWHKLGFLVLAMVAFGFVWADPHLEGDTYALVDGASVISGCLKDFLTFCPGIGGPFPMSFYLVSVGFVAGLNHEQSVIAWVMLSFVGYWFMLWTMYRRLTGWNRTAAVALMLTSPLFYYMSSSDPENIMAPVLLIFAAELIYHERPWMVFVLTAFCCILKEVFPPFVLATFLVIIMGLKFLEQKPLNYKRLMIAHGSGLVVGTTLNILFNYFRGNTYYNVGYLKPEFRHWDWPTTFSNIPGHFFGPSSGLLWFWCAAFLLFTVMAYLSFNPWVSNFGENERKPWYVQHLPGFVVLILFGYAFGLSFWWAPFGWWAWGDRLHYPIIPTLILVSLYFWGDAIRTAIQNIPRALRIFCLMLILYATATSASLVVDNRIIGKWFNGDSVYGALIVEHDPIKFNEYLRYQTWVKNSIIFDHWHLMEKNLGSYGPKLAYALGIWVAFIALNIGREFLGLRRDTSQ